MTLDAADLQAIGAIGGLVLANATLIVTILGGWTFWLVRDVRREMERDRQETARNLQDPPPGGGAQPGGYDPL